MGMAIHQPHDHLFKRVFGAPAEAASFLQARLPRRLSRSLHWPTSLKRRPASFVTPDLRGSASDLLFEIRYAEPGAAQAPLWLYLLFEHQSTPDYWLLLRLLGYCCRIWERDRQVHKDARYLRPMGTCRWSSTRVPPAGSTPRSSPTCSRLQRGIGRGCPGSSTCCSTRPRCRRRRRPAASGRACCNCSSMPPIDTVTFSPSAPVIPSRERRGSGSRGPLLAGAPMELFSGGAGAGAVGDPGSRRFR